MKIEMKKVYYCDYCKKHSLRPLIDHELHCTMNPDRKCGLCGRTTSLSPIIEIIKENMKYDTGPDSLSGKVIIDKPRMEDVFDEVDDCPMCVFAILRQARLLWSYDVHFDLTYELQKWWEKENNRDQYNYM